MDKVSYALGLSIGNNFQNSGINDLQIEDFDFDAQVLENYIL